MKVYFNNSCKICKAEIDLYKKEEIEEIDWVDITDNELAEQETSKDSKQLLRRLHVKDGEKVIGGAEAFLLLWKKMPKYKFLYKFFKLPIIFNMKSSQEFFTRFRGFFFCNNIICNINPTYFLDIFFFI